MRVKTTARNCLYLNWALPVARMPVLPPPLRYEVHELSGERFAFLSALFFRHQGLGLAGLPLLRLAYPQLNVRVYVVDREGIPGVLFRRMLVPVWVLPGMRLVSKHPATAARLHYPRSGNRHPGDEFWHWRAETAEGRLTVRARASSPCLGAGPNLGSWPQMVDYFRQRPLGYSLASDGLRRIETSHPAVPVWPMKAQVEETSLLESCLGHRPWPELHSAFLCPEIPFIFELDAPKIKVLKAPTSPIKAATGPAMLRRRRRDRRAPAA